MESADFSGVEALMHRGLADGVFPGAVILVQKGREIRYHHAFGVTDIHSKAPVTIDTIFDLASLTKPLATTMAVLLLVQTGRLELTRSLGSLLSACKNTPKEKIEIRHLLCHTSGLPAYRPYYKQLVTLPQSARRERLNALLTTEPLDHEIGEKMVYSDLGFMFLRWVVETVSGVRLDHLLAELIYRPLGIGPLFFIDSFRDCSKENFAATQWCPWRKRVIDKVVSDENAYAVGGIDGHAGLFGTAKAVGELMGELIAVYRGEPNKGLFQPQWVVKFMSKDEISDRAFGFDMPTAGASSSGGYFSEKTVGHLGYTGTSFWSDLDTGVSIILLTNRVHPSVGNEMIRTFRPLVHDAVMACLTSSRQ